MFIKRFGRLQVGSFLTAPSSRIVTVRLRILVNADRCRIEVSPTFTSWIRIMILKTSSQFDTILLFGKHARVIGVIQGPRWSYSYLKSRWISNVTVEAHKHKGIYERCTVSIFEVSLTLNFRSIPCPYEEVHVFSRDRYYRGSHSFAYLRSAFPILRARGALDSRMTRK